MSIEHATCTACGGELEQVRPGKHQHPDGECLPVSLANTVHNAVEHMKSLAHKWEQQAKRYEAGSTTAVWLVTMANELRLHAYEFKVTQPGGYE